MRRRISFALCVLSVLISGAEPLLAAKTKPAAKKSKPAAKKKLLGADYGAITDMAGGLLKSVAGSVLKELLFPTKSIDPEKLLADITANVRAELIKNVVEGDETAMTAATTALRRFETEWRAGGDPVEIEKRIAGSSTINLIDQVEARTGPSGKKDYVDPGLPLFIAAAQITANRYELRRLMLPGSDASIRAAEIQHLEEALAHARNVMNRRRDEGMKQRLGSITDCVVTQKRTHGLPWALITTYETAFTDSFPNPYYRGGGSQADDDEGKALARCSGPQRKYFDKIRKSRQPDVDKQWTATDEILDQWAQTIDVLKRSQPPQTARDRRIDFGGMFGIGERSFNNPLTGTTSCPAGYTNYEFKGTFNIDWQAFYCGRIGGVSEPAADFGGMFGQTNDNDSTGTYWINNPITGTNGCPTGFEQADVNNQHKLTYCWRRHVAGQKTPYFFGGMYSDNGEKKNPITDRMLCPLSYSPGLVHGTRGSTGIGATQNVIICWKAPPP